jgi:hypothetical protein
MNRTELVKLAGANGIAKANNTKSEVLITQLTEMGIIKTPGKKTGRKINPNSARQIRLNEMEIKRAAGLLKRGRPPKTHTFEVSVNEEMVAQ